jgi:hypothetical protein
MSHGRNNAYDSIEVFNDFMESESPDANNGGLPTVIPDDKMKITRSSRVSRRKPLRICYHGLGLWKIAFKPKKATGCWEGHIWSYKYRYDAPKRDQMLIHISAEVVTGNPGSGSLKLLLLHWHFCNVTMNCFVKHANQSSSSPSNRTRRRGRRFSLQQADPSQSQLNPQNLWINLHWPSNNTRTLNLEPKYYYVMIWATRPPARDSAEWPASLCESVDKLITSM